MSAQVHEIYPALAEGDRIIVTHGVASDHPDYRGATGTVLQVLATGAVEVEIDHHGISAVFASEWLEVTP